jgi:hypothetical protein
MGSKVDLKKRKRSDAPANEPVVEKKTKTDDTDIDASAMNDTTADDTTGYNPGK